MTLPDAPEDERKAPLKKKCRKCDMIRKYEDCEIGCTLIDKRRDKK
jgi:hypothetical protein